MSLPATALTALVSPRIFIRVIGARQHLTLEKKDSVEFFRSLRPVGSVFLFFLSTASQRDRLFSCFHFHIPYIPSIPRICLPSGIQKAFFQAPRCGAHRNQGRQEKFNRDIVTRSSRQSLQSRTDPGQPFRVTIGHLIHDRSPQEIINQIKSYLLTI